MKIVPFGIGGDYAAWQMTVKGLGPQDTRVQTFFTEETGEHVVKNLKLRRGNRYEIRMTWLKSKKDEPELWYCWEATVDSLPLEQTYNHNNPSRLPSFATAFLVGGHWLADNASGLLTAHTHMKQSAGGNVAGSLVATLLPLEFKTHPDAESGPDKAHKKNLVTRQDETAKHGIGWEKVVCRIWDSSPGTVNLIDYLEGGQGNHSLFESIVSWRVDGTDQQGHELVLGSKPSENGHKHFYVQVMPRNGGNTLDRLIITVVPPETLAKFNTWYAAESTAAGKLWFAECPRMPSSLEVTPLQSPDRLFSPRIWLDPSAIDTFFHPDAFYEIRAKKTPGGHGHQMTFGATGTSILTSVSAGTADKAAAFPENLMWNLHVDADVTPFMWALQLDGNPCDQSTTTLTLPMLHEGVYIRRYMECRPPEPNANPQFTPGGTP